jgi:HK97 family phage major capsid protein
MAALAMLTDEDREQVKGILIEFKEQYKLVKSDIEKLGKADSSTLEKLDKLDTAMIELRQKYDDAQKRADGLEVKLTEQRAQNEPPKSLGELVIADPGFIAHIKSGSRQGYTVSVPRSVKDITGISRTLPERQPGVVGGPQLAYGVRQLVPQGSTTAGAISYVSETAFTNNANVVAEGAAKPKSDKTFTTVVQPVETIAHYFKVSRQSYEDLPGLAAQIEANGIYGVKLMEDQQLLNGSGTPPALRGFMTVATAAPVPGTAAAGFNILDAVGAAIFDLAAKGFMADGTVLNPADWGAVALLKNTQGMYMFANPIQYAAAANLWGTRLVFSSKMAAGSFLAGAFQGNSLILDREEVNVRVAEQNEDDFIKNMLTILVEERLALLIYRADAFEKGVKPVVMEEEPLASEPAGRRGR